MGAGEGQYAILNVRIPPRSMSVTGLCLAGLSDDGAELRDNLGDGGLGGLKGNNLARTRSRNKQLGFA